MIKGIDHVQIAGPPGCEAKMREFYGGLLGMIEVEKPELLKPRGGAWFECGTGSLHIGIEQDFVPAKKAHPAFRVADVGALYETLTASGRSCSWDEMIPGVRRFYVHDPVGNRLEFLQEV
ncbi:MAG TPA: VOC family protein [Fimbriimonadaceae bacterium]|nr:VOC family protein [Fimbriimonadaceae bacterium]